MNHHLQIEYCPKSGWLLRAAYFAQEFLTTFDGYLESVTLKPSPSNGAFRITVNDQLLFDRKSYGGFPEIKELKQLIRDQIAPDKKLGHSDTPVHNKS